MASDTAYSPSPPAPPTAHGENHRKRRRNRTRVSCLNCYASKRKCDRKRPCTRCINHGLTGLCFYELADPAAHDDTSTDETTRLRRRVAELESVVRAMNNRPHPRWTAPDGVTHRPTRARRTRASSPDVDAFFTAEAGIKVKVEPELIAPEFTPSESDPASPAAGHSAFGSPLTPLLPDLITKAEPPLSAGPDTECWTPSSEEGPPLAQMFDVHTYASTGVQTLPPPPSPPSAPCDCLASATLHSPLVYFASALRASREALEGSHPSGSTCLLLRRIIELDSHIFSVAPPDPPPVLDLGSGEDPPRLVTPPLTQPLPTLPSLQSSPYSHPDIFSFLDVSLYPSLGDWP